MLTHYSIYVPTQEHLFTFTIFKNGLNSFSLSVFDFLSALTSYAFFHCNSRVFFSWSPKDFNSLECHA